MGLLCGFGVCPALGVKPGPNQPSSRVLLGNGVTNSATFATGRGSSEVLRGKAVPGAKGDPKHATPLSIERDALRAVVMGHAIPLDRCRKNDDLPVLQTAKSRDGLDAVLHQSSKPPLTGEPTRDRGRPPCPQAMDTRRATHLQKTRCFNLRPACDATRSTVRPEVSTCQFQPTPPRAARPPEGR